MAAITQGELRVNTSIPIIDIKKLDMEMYKNRHAMIRLEGLIPEEVGEEVLLQPLGQSGIEVLAGDEVLFRGIVKNVNVTRDGNGYGVVLEGVSASQILDCVKKNRTFQNTNRTYMEVIQEVLEETGSAGMIFNATDRHIDRPLYQIEETDWEFILRLASRLSAAVVPSVLSAGAGIYIGLPGGRRWRTDGEDIVQEKIGFDRRNHCLEQEIGAYENRNIGDYLSWQGQDYVIISKKCEMRQGLLYYVYGISKRDVFSISRFENPEHGGRMLPATVLDTQAEQIKVRFDVDRTQRVEDAYWYAWRPDVGNLMYCMPERGEKVYIQLGHCEGEPARAVCTVHGNGAGNPEMKKNDRYFTTADKKRMYLTPETIGFRDLKQKEALEVELNDRTGAAVRSNKKIVISAKETIGLKGNTISVKSPQELSIVRRNQTAPTVINMCNGFDSVGASNEVKMEGAGEPGFPIFHESGQNIESNFELVGVKQSIVATTPAVKLQSVEEMQIGAGMVNQMLISDSSESLIGDFRAVEEYKGSRWENERGNKDRWNGKKSGDREIKPFNGSKQSDTGSIEIESMCLSVREYQGNGSIQTKKADSRAIQHWF